MGPTLDDVPDEILLTIVRALDSASSVACLASASRRYCDLLDDDAVWRHLCRRRFGPPLHEGFVGAGKDWRWLYRAQSHPAAKTGPDVGAVMTPGRIYWGDTVDGLPHGYGLSLALPTPHRDGRGFTRRLGDDDALSETEPRHDGCWHRGRAHGYGVRVYRNGSRYRGAWEDDAHHGYGERIDSLGWHYAGLWHRGHRHGEGPCSRKDGCSDLGPVYLVADLYPHVGDISPTEAWRATPPDLALERQCWAACGGGVLTLSNGAVFRQMRGNANNNVWGTVTWTSGARFVGRWKNWGMHHRLYDVEGTLFYADGRIARGHFWNGDHHWRGALWRSSDGLCVECDRWYGCSPALQVTITWPDGRKYQGAWRGSPCYKGDDTVGAD
jgi:hypothetical protein